MTFFSPNPHFAWYFMGFLVRTSYTAADTLTAESSATKAGSLVIPSLTGGASQGTRTVTLALGFAPMVTAAERAEASVERELQHTTRFQPHSTLVNTASVSRSVFEWFAATV